MVKKAETTERREPSLMWDFRKSPTMPREWMSRIPDAGMDFPILYSCGEYLELTESKKVMMRDPITAR
jgi:hypothetical protein